MSESSPGAGGTVPQAHPADVPADVPAESQTTGALIGQAGQQLSDLVSQEMELARAELQQTVKHAVTGASLFGAAGLLAFYGGAVLITAAVFGLALVLDAWLAAVIVAVVLFAGAGIAAVVGKKEVDQAPAPMQQSAANVKADVDTVKNRSAR